MDSGQKSLHRGKQLDHRKLFQANSALQVVDSTCSCFASMFIVASWHRTLAILAYAGAFTSKLIAPR